VTIASNAGDAAVLPSPAGDPGAVDLRRAPLAEVRAVDLRAGDRDFWADELAVHDRLLAVCAGLDDAAWRLPGAAPSDAGGPDWSLLDHVAHLVAWQELAIDYLGRVLDGGRWPTDDDFAGGFDAFNERLRDPWAALEPATFRERAEATRAGLLDVVHRLPMETIRSDDAWEWVYLVLHGHALDHLTVIEPWADILRIRQIEGDPFAVEGADRLTDPAAPIASFWAAEASIGRAFEAAIAAVPFESWDAGPGPTEGWTLKDHLNHLTSWFDEASDALDDHRRSGGWRSGPPEGVDAWNARAVARDRGLPPSEAYARYRAGRARLSAAIRALDPADLRDPEGWSWAYEDLHGHIRAHLAMVGPWCARAGWPADLGGT